MAGHAGACHLAEIQTHVEALRFDQFAESLRVVRERTHGVQVLVVGEFMQRPDVPQRCHQQMAIGVRIAVEHHQHVIIDMHHEILTVGGGQVVVVGRGAAEKAGLVGPFAPLSWLQRLVELLLALNVSQAPRRPNALFVHVRLLRGEGDSEGSVNLLLDASKRD